MLKDVRIPLAPLLPHLRDHLTRADVTPTQFDRELSVPTDTTRIILTGRHKTIEFNLADKIITRINPFLWRTDPELASVYQEVDFSQAKEYDPETEFPCGHPRVETNMMFRRYPHKRSPGYTCRTCDQRRARHRNGVAREQLKLIRDVA